MTVEIGGEAWTWSQSLHDNLEPAHSPCSLYEHVREWMHASLSSALLAA